MHRGWPSRFLRTSNVERLMAVGHKPDHAARDDAEPKPRARQEEWVWLGEERDVAAGQASGLAGHDSGGSSLVRFEHAELCDELIAVERIDDDAGPRRLDPRGAGRREGESRIVDRDDVESNVRGLCVQARRTRQCTGYDDGPDPTAPGARRSSLEEHAHDRCA